MLFISDFHICKSCENSFQEGNNSRNCTCDKNSLGSIQESFIGNIQKKENSSVESMSGQSVESMKSINGGQQDGQDMLQQDNSVPALLSTSRLNCGQHDGQNIQSFDAEMLFPPVEMDENITRDSNQTINQEAEAINEKDDSSLTITNPEDKYPLRTIWECRQQKGYKYTGFPTKVKASLHAEIEDFYFPSPIFDNDFSTMDQDGQSDSENRIKQQHCSIWGDQVFLMADGHAGHEAPYFFISGLSRQILSLLNSKKYDFGDEGTQQELRSQLEELFLDLDDEYTEIKIREYQAWVKSGSNPRSRPIDDGCTMVVNILQSGWLLNCNVGDSRTVLAQPCSIYGKDWFQVFSSTDHNMMHAEKVYSIFRNGGRFLDSTGSAFLNVSIQSPDERQGKDYTELVNARLYRPLSDEVRAVGCSHRRTLNLAGTMGDVLFKINPPVLTSMPDISIVRLEANTEYLLIVGTDGIWDHLVPSNSERQNNVVIDRVTGLLADLLDKSVVEMDANMTSRSFSSTSSQSTTESDTFTDCSNSSTSSNPAHKGRSSKFFAQAMAQGLGSVCEMLVNRESGDGIYSKNLLRYDDATLMLIHIE